MSLGLKLFINKAPRVKQAISIHPENDKDPIETIALKFGKLKGHGFDAMALELL